MQGKYGFKCLRLLLLAIALSIGMICAACRAPADAQQGGKLIAADFEDGFEAFAFEGNAENLEENIKRITDEETKAEIYETCLKITCYREINGAEDIMLGGDPADMHLAGIVFACGACAYKIDVIRWENYAGDAWTGWPIRNELYGEPLLCIWRIELKKEELDGESIPGAVAAYSGRDSFNSEAGRGWYATLPQEEMDSLCAILSAEGGISLQ